MLGVNEYVRVLCFWFWVRRIGRERGEREEEERAGAGTTTKGGRLDFYSVLSEGPESRTRYGRLSTNAETAYLPLEGRSEVHAGRRRSRRDFDELLIWVFRRVLGEFFHLSSLSEAILTLLALLHSLRRSRDHKKRVKITSGSTSKASLARFLRLHVLFH